jgi:hypothetical protein
VELLETARVGRKRDVNRRFPERCYARLGGDSDGGVGRTHLLFGAVLDLLKRPEEVTLAALMKATGFRTGNRVRNGPATQSLRDEKSVWLRNRAKPLGSRTRRLNSFDSPQYTNSFIAGYEHSRPPKHLWQQRNAGSSIRTRF